jgi:hypothetical protein
MERYEVIVLAAELGNSVSLSKDEWGLWRFIEYKLWRGIEDGRKG